MGKTVKITFNNGLSIAALVLSILGLVFLCSFKVLDRDFWWHVKAGEIISEKQAVITVEPFAYTREGQPYKATHEWLAQVIFYEIYNSWGANGIIIFRTIMVCLTFLLLLLIAPRYAWLNIPIVVWAAYISRASLMDRPQLFTYLFFSIFLLLAFYYLSHIYGTDMKDKKKIWWLAGAAIVLQILWVNLHGAAAILSIILSVGLTAQAIYDWYAQRGERKQQAKKQIWILAGVSGALVIAALCSPTTYKTLTDIYTLSTDATIPLVKEWQPRTPNAYASELGPFWLITLTALFVGRKKWVFSAAILAVLGYLSLQSFRHGVPFVIVASAITIYQFAGSRQYKDFVSWLTKYPLVALATLLVVYGGIGYILHDRYNAEFRRNQFAGYGQYAPAQEAYDFIEKENLKGNMFNTYNLGGYLLYRGYPDRKIYIDGRNVEYGYSFLKPTLDAGTDPKKWQELDEKYNFGYAVIDLVTGHGKNYMGYTVHLNTNPKWKLVYLNDWTAVYAKDTKENEDIVKKHGYTFITPESIEFGTLLGDAQAEEKIQKELERQVAGSKASIKGRILLSRYYLDKKMYEEAKKVALEAAAIQSNRPEVYEVLGSIAAEQENWLDAGDYFEKSVNLAGPNDPMINYEYLASIFSKTGDWKKATHYHNLSLRNPLPSIDPSLTPTPHASPTAN